MHSSRPYRILRLSIVGEYDPAADDTYTAVTHAALWNDNITHGRSRQASPEQSTSPSAQFPFIPSDTVFAMTGSGGITILNI